MSYGYGGGPNWPMIQARRRAEDEAGSARREGAAHRASAERWKSAFEALAGRVRTAVERTGAEHRDSGRCGCLSCWDAVIAELARKAEGGGTAGGPGAAGSSSFSFDHLFGGSGPQHR